VIVTVRPSRISLAQAAFLAVSLYDLVHFEGALASERVPTSDDNSVRGGAPSPSAPELRSSGAGARMAAERFRAAIIAGDREAIAARIREPGFLCVAGEEHDFPMRDDIVRDLRRGSGTWFDVFFGKVNPYPGRGAGVSFRQWFKQNPLTTVTVQSGKFGKKGEEIGYEVVYCSSKAPETCAYPMWLFLLKGQWWLGFGTGCM
jgi:hypothetical protein